MPDRSPFRRSPARIIRHAMHGQAASGRGVVSRSPARRFRFCLPAALILAIGSAGPARPAPAPSVVRVLLDRLTWAPDGSALAAEARLLGLGAPRVDTLLIDLTRGALAVRDPRPSLFAFDPAGRRLAVAGPYGLMAGPAAAPESLALVASRDPAAREILRLAFNQGGDSLMVLSTGRDGRWLEISAWPGPGGRENLRLKSASREEAGRLWLRLAGAGEPDRVMPVPLPHLYQPVRRGLFHVEQSSSAVPGVSSFWLFNLFWRDGATGQSRPLAANILTFESVLSPDSSWLAVVGQRARPDYGGSMLPTLWIASTDGATFFSVQAEGVRDDRPVEVQALAWRGGELWYSTAEGLFRLDPARGRSRRVAVGPAPPEWSRELRPGAEIWSLLSVSTWSDTLPAARERERLRALGLPAWVAVAGRGYRVALGAEKSEAALGPLAGGLPADGERFVAARLPAAESGIPFPFAVLKSPVDSREAYLNSSGPPGQAAGEIWLSERHGARQIRLVRAMRFAPED